MIAKFLLTIVLYHVIRLFILSNLPCKMVVVWLIRPLTWH